MMSVDSDVVNDQETRLAELYCVCMETQTLPRLFERAGQKLLEMIPAEFVTYLDVSLKTMHICGRRPSDAELPRITAHANRCLEGTDKSPSDDGELTTVQHGTQQRQVALAADADLIWTGAVERDGRLIGVVTLYGPNRRLTASDKQTLRSARTMLGDAVSRLSDLTALQNEGELANGVDVFVVSIDTSIASGDVTGLLMSRLQDAIAKRLAGSIPDAFMVAKLGINRLMVVGHPDHPLPLERWESLCKKAVASLDEKLGYRLQLNLSEGDLDKINEVAVCGLVSKPNLSSEQNIQRSA
jgi:hypothetical protein